jgi:hypothetical protein
MASFAVFIDSDPEPPSGGPPGAGVRSLLGITAWLADLSPI